MKPLAGILALGAAVAVLFAAAALLRTPHFEAADAGPLIERTAHLTLFDARGPLRAGEQLPTNPMVGVSFVNPRTDGLQLIVYAIDSAGAYHWLVPYQLPGGKRDWASKGLPPAPREAIYMRPAQLGELPPGPLTFVAILNPSPILLEKLDTFSPEGHTPEGLRGRFPDAVILSWPVTVVGSN